MLLLLDARDNSGISRRDPLTSPLRLYFHGTIYSEGRTLGQRSVGYQNLNSSDCLGEHVLLKSFTRSSLMR